MTQRARIDRPSGGMPSPTRRIPITVVASDWFESVSDASRQAFIPSSIAAGETVTLEDAVKVRIRPNRVPPLPGTRFLEQDSLSIQAEMPWLKRALPHFNYSRPIVIQYPAELREYSYLPSLAQGSTSRFTFEVSEYNISFISIGNHNHAQLFNKSAVALGSSTDPSREIQVVCSFPLEYGALQSNVEDWGDESIQDISTLDPMSAVSISQVLRILHQAQSHQHVNINLALYISEPSDVDVATDGGMTLIQQEDLRIQISSQHVYNARSAFLLVTNSDTTRLRVQAIKSLITNNLQMQMDEWNISLHGGFNYQAEEGEMSVLADYQGKSIIFLGNTFNFVNGKERRIPDFCDARTLAELGVRRTSYLIFGGLGGLTLDSLIKNFIFPVPCATTDLGDHALATGTFESKGAMIDSIKQTKLIGSSTAQIYTIPVKGRWYRFGKASTSYEARKLAGWLQQRLPQERFLVTTIDVPEEHGESATKQQAGEVERTHQEGPASQARSNLGKLAILHGSSHEASINATDEQSRDQIPVDGSAQALEQGPNSASASLGPFEAFMLVQILPVSMRIDILWTQHAAGTILPGTECSAKALENVSLSVIADINNEIWRHLHKAKWPNSMEFPQNLLDSRSFLRLHLPTLSTLLQHQRALSQEKPPEYVIEVLEYAEVSCFSQKKRQLACATVMPFLQRRRLLRKFLNSVINDFLHRNTYTKDEVAAFHSRARSRHSYRDSSRRDTSKTILTRLSELTKVSEHVFTHSHTTTANGVPRSTYCTAL